MNILRFLSVMLACGTSMAALACDYPPLVAVPDGETATVEELVAAQAGVKTYMAEMELYLECIDEETAVAGDDAPAQYKAIMASRYNAAVAEMEAIAESFNNQVKAYKEAHPEEG